MNSGLLLAAWLTPLLAAPLAFRPAASWLAGLAALPALVAALTLPTGSRMDLPWLLLGVQLGLDASGRIFLLFTSILWLVAGLQACLTMDADPRAGRFRLFFLLAMAGNLWLIVGQDLPSFYLGFSLMGLSAYGLVIHVGDAAALRAGRVYLAMTLVADVALFAALVFIFGHSGALVPGPQQLVGLDPWGIGLLLLGLGIKGGLLGLHFWLPLAHPAAPVPASAVLSGAMIKAALIGWLRFLPLGAEALPGWGALMISVGILTVLYALPVGLTQSNPKVVLAYSSVGKMGLMTGFLGAALVDPGLAPVLAILVTLYAAHHGLAKGALFLGVGIARHTRATWVVGVLALAALVLAGAPFTSGALAKGLVKPELAGLVAPWGTTLSLALGASTLGTTLLLARFLFLVGSERAAEAAYTTAAALPWLTLMALLLSGPYVLGLPFPSPAASWPVLAGVLLALSLALSRPHLATRLVGRVPPGDLLSPLARAFGRLSRRAFSMGTRVVVVSREVLDRLPIHIASSSLARDDRVERVLALRPVSGALFLGIAAALLVLAALGRG